MKVRLSKSARTYLRFEVAYLRQYSARAADGLIAQIEEAMTNLARFPDIGRGIDRLPMPGMHRLVVGSYVVEYQSRTKDIVIMSIRHGRQQPPEGVDQPDEEDYET